MEDILFLFHIRIRMGAAIVPVGIRKGIVQIHVESSVMSTVVTIATDMSVDDL